MVLKTIRDIGILVIWPVKQTENDHFYSSAIKTMRKILLDIFGHVALKTRNAILFFAIWRLKQ
jgi:hypothetical protein